MVPQHAEEHGRVDACARERLEQLHDQVAHVLKGADDHVRQVADELELQGAAWNRPADADGSIQRLHHGPHVLGQVRHRVQDLMESTCTMRPG